MACWLGGCDLTCIIFAWPAQVSLVELPLVLSCLWFCPALLAFCKFSAMARMDGETFARFELGMRRRAVSSRDLRAWLDEVQLRRRETQRSSSSRSFSKSRIPEFPDPLAAPEPKRRRSVSPKRRRIIRDELEERRRRGGEES